eukprot:11619101-Alexandrium_andersonii.AAC.1
MQQTNARWAACPVTQLREVQPRATDVGTNDRKPQSIGTHTRKSMRSDATEMAANASATKRITTSPSNEAHTQ